MREEEETAATEKSEVEMEEEKNRLTIELENEQRVTLGMCIIVVTHCIQYITFKWKVSKIYKCILIECSILWFKFLEVEHWLRDRHKFLSNLHEEWTVRLRDEVAAKEAELQALIDAREADK